MEVTVAGNSLGDYYKFDSGVDYININWGFEKYQYKNPSHRVSNEPLVSIDLPLFPDYRSAIREFVGIDVDRYSDAYGIIFCLPNYGARIREINISSAMLKVNIEAKSEATTDIIGKLYYTRGKDAVKENIAFGTGETSSIMTLKYKPQHFHIMLLSKKSGEVLDERRFGLNWDLPKGVIVDIPEYELLELIKNGENQTVELKEKIGEPTEFAETVVAFANQQGGVIVLGVNDKTNIVGLDNRDHYKDTITNIISSHCVPSIDYSVEERTLQEKKLILVKVMEGKDKPYMLRERGAYIRANGTDRIATRFELDEFYRLKSSGGSGLRSYY
ncbi:MAG: ATP-binding protein [Candidatus Bathyarchaeota archaeon]|nr:ATP-binding protein [Candidatus Bathyarchaeota archaeon]